MKQRYILYQRKNGKFYAEDTVTKKQSSLKTRSKAEALTLLHSKNEAMRQQVMNLQIARVYLQHSDSTYSTRTWQNVLDEMVASKTGENKERWKRVSKSKRLNFIRNLLLIDTIERRFTRKLLIFYCQADCLFWIQAINSARLAANRNQG